MTLNPTVGLGQFLAAPGDVQANLDFLGRLDEAGPEGLDLMCFPELCLPGYLLDAQDYTASLARDLRRAEEAIQGVADAADVRIVYGTARWVADRLHNCVVLAEPHAGATTYNKVHLAGTERAVFSAGGQLVLTPTAVSASAAATTWPSPVSARGWPRQALACSAFPWPGSGSAPSSSRRRSPRAPWRTSPMCSA